MNTHSTLFRDHLELHLNKIGALLTVTDEILAFNDDAWIDELFYWANANYISAANFPRDKEKLIALTHLRLNCSSTIATSQNNTPITDFPIALARLTNLTTVSLAGNNLVSLPAFVTQLPDLLHLDLYDNTLSTLPDSITELTKLTRLDLSHNLFVFLPESIGLLTNLTDLYLGYNHLMELPVTISGLKNLTSLSLISNPKLRLSHSIHQLSQLTSLDLRHNQLSRLHENFGKLVNLTHFDLSHNRLTELPEFIGQLSQLIELNLNYNRLSALPESFSRLMCLQSLYLCDNELEQIPEAIAKLEQLSCLVLRNNHLQVVPEFLSQLQNLSYLDLSNNNIAKIPDSVRNLPQLTELRANLQTGKHQVTSSEDIKFIAMLREFRFEESSFRKLIDERVNREWEINQFDYLYMQKLGDLIAEILKLRLQTMAAEPSNAKTTAAETYKNFLVLQQEVLNNGRRILCNADQQTLHTLYHKTASLCNPCKLSNEYRAVGETLFKSINKAYLHQDLASLQAIHLNLSSNTTFANLDYASGGIAELNKKIEAFQRLNAILANKINLIVKNKTYKRITKIANPASYIEIQGQLLTEQLKELRLSARKMEEEEKLLAHSDDFEKLRKLQGDGNKAEELEKLQGKYHSSLERIKS